MITEQMIRACLSGTHAIDLAVDLFVDFFGRGGALVESMPFDRNVVGFNPALAATQGPWWASPSLAVACSSSACKLRQCQFLWSEALLKGSCCEKRYRNG